MKCIAVDMGGKCIKEPRCSFCYVGDIHENLWATSDAIDALHDNWPSATIAMEYSGYNLAWWLDVLCYYNETPTITMTTMPQCVTPALCGAIKAHGWSAISISYNSEVCRSVAEWVLAAKIARHAGLSVGCNFLLEAPFEPFVARDILTNADQLNILSMKPTGELSQAELGQLEAIIEEEYKRYTQVTVDNCLGVQLGLIDGCRRGKDFVHVLCDGTIEDCCFKGGCHLYG